ncbi:MAG: sodium:proline symporter, partial [Terrimicrobium sp.]
MAPDSTSGLLVDGLVVFFYFAVIIAIGLYKGRGSKDLESFAVGNRNIPWWAVLASILAAEISAATFLGAPGEGYEKRNFTYAQLALGTILARVVIAYIFIKPYYDFRVVSIYEYLLLRFGTRTKNTASAVFLITRALASGTRLYVAAIVFVMGYEMVSGETLNIWQQVWIYIAALSAITALTAVYTALGGIKEVVWTDVIQACIMFGSLGFAIWSLLRAIPGGWQGATAALNQPNDWQFFSSGVEASRTFGENVRSILESEYTIWAALIGSTFTTLATHGTDQDMVQRMLTAKDHHRSRLSLILSGLADL